MLFRIFASAAILVSQSLWAEGTDLNSRLAKFQEHMHRRCKIESAQMKLVFACHRMQLHNSNPRFHATVPGSTGGVSYCFNGLVKYDAARKVVQVLKDDGASARQYQILPRDGETLENAPAGALNIPLKGMQAYCYSPNQQAARQCSNGFLGIGGTNPTMILSINRPDSPTPQHTGAVNLNDEVTKRNETKLRSSDTVNADISNEIALQYAQNTLLAYTKSKLSGPRQDFPSISRDEIQTCRDAILDFEEANPSVFEGKLYQLQNLSQTQLADVHKLINTAPAGSSEAAPAAETTR